MKKVLLTLLVILMVSFTSSTASSNQYTQTGNNKYGKYYTSVSEETLEDAFSLKIENIQGKDEVLQWLNDKKTFTVIKVQDGKETIYFNTPNTQQLIWNLYYKEFMGGYNNKAYTGGSSTSLMDYFGFSIPNFTYVGEYPVVTISMNGVVPTRWYQQLWRGVKSLFGASFTEPPTTENYSTLTYLNAHYQDTKNSTIQFIQKYWNEWWKDSITTVGFSSPQECFETFVSDEAHEESQQYIRDNQWQYDIIKQKVEEWEQQQIDAYEQQLLEWEANKINLEGVLTPKPELDLQPYIYTETEQEFMDVWNAHQELIARHYTWHQKFKKIETGKIPYNQCLITTEGEPGSCIKNEPYEAQLSLYEIYIPTQLYKVDGSTEDGAIQILQTIQATAGPHYLEVMSNIMSLMSETSNGIAVMNLEDDGNRIMPYDTTTMVISDRENIAKSDPRVERWYKFHEIVGDKNKAFPTLVTTTKVRFKNSVVNFTGNLSRLNIWMSDLISFELWDELGISPVVLWKSPVVSLIWIFLILFFVLQLFVVIKDIAYSGWGGAAKEIFKKGIVTIGIIAFMFVMSIWPEQIWDTTKKTFDLFSTIGEQTVVANEEYGQLMGDDVSSLYWVQYFDIWSTYNTGYSIFDDRQVIDINSGLTEVENLQLPVINENEYSYWSVLLANSFRANEVRAHISNDAYRVVDHFMAPRVNLISSGNSYSVRVTDNENFNDRFGNGIIIHKVVNSLHISILTLCKLLTYAFLWFNLFALLYNILMMKPEQRKFKEVMIETFSPYLGVVGIGVYISFILQVSALFSSLNWLLCLLFELMLVRVTMAILIWWEDTGKSLWFPDTLKPITALCRLVLYGKK